MGRPRVHAAVALGGSTGSFMVEKLAPASYVTEFLGTFVLTLSYNFTSSVANAAWAPVSIGCVLMALVYSLGKVSGANFNPAISFCMLLIGEKDKIETLAFVLAQSAGSLVAASAFFTVGGQHPLADASASGYSWVQIGLTEMIFTTVLCFVYLNVVVTKGNSGMDQLYGLIIGLALIAGGYAAGHISGGYFNPAIVLSYEVMSKGVGMYVGFVCIVFHAFAAVIAAILFRICRPDFFDELLTEYLMHTKLVAEAFGTFVYVFTLGLTVISKSSGESFAVAAAHVIMVSSLSSVSGSHFNPAITWAVACTRYGRWNWCILRDSGAYVLAQLVGATLAACTYTYIENGERLLVGPGPGFGWEGVALAEIGFTCLLCYVVLAVTMPARDTAPPPQHLALATGACLVSASSVVGAVSGSFLNPAVSLAVSLFEVESQLPLSITYCALEITGGCCASIAFFAMHPSEYVLTEGTRASEGQPLVPLASDVNSREDLAAIGNEQLHLQVQRQQLQLKQQEKQLKVQEMKWLDLHHRVQEQRWIIEANQNSDTLQPLSSDAFGQVRSFRRPSSSSVHSWAPVAEWTREIP
eukprot:TRINITY_DN8743_c0_g2_i1.p1 TRINITY_DN8743_c0_g2~~TRINITY_DN8743_c0_g2_i1.p1  ORF type:complete len:583 (+),score=93.76 TRINITY_DN8743_c0_g2_i1:130-1878(+)